MSRMVATTIHTEAGWTKMVYHKTVVAQYAVDPLGASGTKFGSAFKVKLDTGGFFTVTTKKRMNQFAKMFGLPFSVFQKNKVWYVEVEDEEYKLYKFNGNTCEFTIYK